MEGFENDSKPHSQRILLSFGCMRMTYLYLSGFALFILVAWLASCSNSPEVTTQPGTYLNLSADAQYVGMNACQSCHSSIYESYLETGMGKSLYRPRRVEAIERFGPDAIVHDQTSGYSYHPYWQGDDFYILEFRRMGRDTTFTRREKIDYIVGSGHQTRSYLMERNQYFYEMPITWYVNSQRWDLSPGYENGNNTRFDREIGEECMACHTGHIEFEPKSTNRFRQVSLGIDCEKCHGPGSIHIARKEAGELVDVGREIDYSIVNPAKLDINLQFDVCQQCHLQGVTVLKGDHPSVTDFRPGMALNQVYDIFIERDSDTEDFGIASHAERLKESRCFISSGDSLTCTTCHNPHKSISFTDPGIYAKQCQSCHSTKKDLNCGVAPAMMAAEGGNCITCHMPKRGTSDIPHVKFTDHKIRVVKDSVQTAAVKSFVDLVCMTSETPSSDARGKAFLAYYERNAQEPRFLNEADKLLGSTSHFERATSFFYQGNYPAALEEIDQAIAITPNDPWLRFRQGQILEGLGRFEDAIDAYQRSFQLPPFLTEAGLKVGILTLNSATDPSVNRTPQQALIGAEIAFGQILEAKPFDKRSLTNMGFVKMNSGDTAAADSLFKAALALDPFHIQALSNEVVLQKYLDNNVAQVAYEARLEQAKSRKP